MTTMPPAPRPDTLGDLGAPERAELEARIERWWPDVHAGLARLYGEKAAGTLGQELLEVAVAANARRPERLRARDRQRLATPDWLQDPAMIGYAGYADRMADDLPGVASRIGHLQGLGVTYLHLMPLLATRDGDNDGGYAVTDYAAVRPDLGTMDDLENLADRLHEAGISLVLDLVLNHVAREHEWARRARAGESRYRDYFYVYDDRTQPDAFEATLPEVFPDFAPGNFTWDEGLDGWVWTTFNEWQWDVNWSNPAVLGEYARIILDLANRGVDVLRLDAIAFIWKRLGTDCQGQPEVHDITRVLRALARIAAPALSFKAEAIVAPSKVVAYLGDGEYAGKVSDLAYQNSLMVQIWSMLASKDARLSAQALGSQAPKAEGGTWLTYVRCHDDIGWAIQDEDASAVGLGGFEHRAFLSDWYSGDFPGSPARGLVFQHNPRNGDRRISGTTASLAGLESALAGGDPGAVELSLRAIRLAYAIAYGWGGIPVVFSGDEFAQLNDPDWAAEAGHGEDNRWAHRPRLAHRTVRAGGDGGDPADRAYLDLAHLGAVRAALPHLHASVESRVWPIDDPGVFVTVREHAAGRFVGVYNITPEPHAWPLATAAQLGVDRATNALTGMVPERDDRSILLAPYDVLWLTSHEGDSPDGHQV